jgi:tetraacyldisaccharide 4'-kinase
VPPSSLSWFARPVAAIYAAVARRRRAAASRRRRRLRSPVVSIGSLRAGGSGKTPTAAFVAEVLRDLGYTPSVLSRGYRREEPTDGALVVRDRVGLLADVRRAGDEPSLLAHLLPGCAVIVGADRHLSGVLAEARLGCTVHVLDDGFQHVGLARAVDLLLVTRDDLGSAVLPAGPLREDVTAARFATAWLVPRDELGEMSELARACRVERVFGMSRVLQAPVLLEGDPSATVERTTPVLLVSGIANPDRFETDLVADGWRVVDHAVYRDHHPFDASDVAALARRVRCARAEVVFTTAKDAVRLLRWRPLPFPTAMVPLTVRLEPEGAFAHWLQGAIAQGIPRERRVS